MGGFGLSNYFSVHMEVSAVQCMGMSLEDNCLGGERAVLSNASQRLCPFLTTTPFMDIKT